MFSQVEMLHAVQASTLAQVDLPDSPVPENPVPLENRDRQLLDLEVTLEDETLRDLVSPVLRRPGVEPQGSPAEGEDSAQREQRLREDWFLFSGGPKGNTGRFTTAASEGRLEEEVALAVTEVLAFKKALADEDRDPSLGEYRNADKRHSHQEITDEYIAEAREEYTALKEQFEARYQEITKNHPDAVDYSFEQYIVDVVTYDQNSVLTEAELMERVGQSFYGKNRDVLAAPYRAYFGHANYPGNFYGRNAIEQQELNSALEDVHGESIADARTTRENERAHGHIIDVTIHAPEAFHRGAKTVELDAENIEILLSHNQVAGKLGELAVLVDDKLELVGDTETLLTRLSEDENARLVLSQTQQQLVQSAVPGSDTTEAAISSILNPDTGPAEEFTKLNLDADGIRALINHPDLKDLGPYSLQQAEISHGHDVAFIEQALKYNGANTELLLSAEQQEKIIEIGSTGLDEPATINQAVGRLINAVANELPAEQSELKERYQAAGISAMTSTEEPEVVSDGPAQVSVELTDYAPPRDINVIGQAELQAAFDARREAEAEDPAPDDEAATPAAEQEPTEERLPRINDYVAAIHSLLGGKTFLEADLSFSQKIGMYQRFADHGPAIRQSYDVIHAESVEFNEGTLLSRMPGDSTYMRELLTGHGYSNRLAAETLSPLLNSQTDYSDPAQRSSLYIIAASIPEGSLDEGTGTPDERDIIKRGISRALQVAEAYNFEQEFGFSLADKIRVDVE